MSHETRRSAIAVAAAALFSVGLSSSAAAQTCTKQVTIIVPYAPGGT